MNRRPQNRSSQSVSSKRSSNSDVIELDSIDGPITSGPSKKLKAAEKDLDNIASMEKMASAFTANAEKRAKLMDKAAQHEDELHRKELEEKDIDIAMKKALLEKMQAEAAKAKLELAAVQKQQEQHQ
uniref:Uncharacterized protein n=1 Tax=Panagrolaimus sp. ES5 TaxID=591445 RepID=A0AC34FS91_9BILA